MIKSDRKLVLPKYHYGPFCNKILKEFIEENNLDEKLSLPQKEDNNSVAISKIFDIILHSLGDEKRQRLLKECDEYVMGLPKNLR